MTNIYSISLFKFTEQMEDPIFMCSVYDLSTIGYFQRTSVKEFIKFFSRTFIKKCPINKRQSIVHDEFIVHCYLRYDGLGGVIVSNAEFKERIAFTLIDKLMNKFMDLFKDKFLTNDHNDQDQSINFEFMNEIIKNPMEFDQITKINEQLDETIDIIHKTIDSVLDRGEKLETLIQHSDDLSRHSQMFYRTASSQNKCCIIQ